MNYCQDIYKFLSKCYPDSKIYLISDHHFYHQNILQYTRNRFKNVETMNQFIIDSHNKIVNDEDIVIFLGDFSFKNFHNKELLSHLHGHKFLIIGNHDSENLLKKYPAIGFEAVFKNPVKINNNYLSHEPLTEMQEKNVQFKLIVNEFKKNNLGKNYHGHIHTNETNNFDKYFNVTCEALDYQPILIGKTENAKENDKPLFINSPDFSIVLDDINSKYGICPKFLFKDYIYTFLLSSLKPFRNSFFVQGSFGLYKKYQFISDFSDLDISFFYNYELSKSKNYDIVKRIIDNTFESSQVIDKVNLSFIKRYPSLRIFELLYTSENPYFVKCFLDANLINISAYKNTDFLELSSLSTIEKILKKEDNPLIDQFVFPEFTSKFLIPEGDMANLLLQILFQLKNENKRILALKKLQYLNNHIKKYPNIKLFNDIFIRFFLRNIVFLYTLHRYNEIQYIKELFNELPKLINYFPNNIQNLVKELLKQDSIFLEIYQELFMTKIEDIGDKSRELIKKIYNYW